VLRALVFAATGCTVPPPFYGLEAPSALPAGRVSVTGAVGAGCENTSCSGALGGAARFRLGVGGGQEVGLDAEALTDYGPAYGARLAYKLAPRDGLALTAGLGASYQTGFRDGAIAVLGGDVGAIVALVELDRDTPLYGALRGVVGVPTWSAPMADTGGTVVIGALALGISHPVSPHVHVIGEAAVLDGWQARGGQSAGVTAALALGWTP